MTIHKFDNRHSPAARYDFDGDLLDRSGNGLHLTGAGAVFRPVYQSALGLSPSGALSRNGVSDAVLRDLDELTIQALLVLRSVPSATWLCSVSAGGDPEAANYLWSIQLASHGSLTYFTEHGAGVDLSPLFTAAPSGRGLPALGVLFHLALRLRAVSGGLQGQFFVDGVPFGDPSGTMPAPTGGTSAQLLLNQSASTAYDLLAFEFVPTALTDAQIKDSHNATLGEAFGPLETEVQSLWVGALGSDGVTVTAPLSYASDAVRLAVTGPGGTVYSASLDVDHGVPAKLAITGLAADTLHSYEIESDGLTLPGPTGSFKTAPTGNASFTVAFSGDAASGSNHLSFEAIRNLEPLCFVHLGDAHYHNIATNDPKAFRDAFDEMFRQPRQAELYANVPTVYVWDDHDYGANNSNGSSPSKPAAAATYRARVPHYPLPDSSPTGSIYQSFDVGRVRFVVTDQRSAASPDSATDDSSKTMLGTAQKAWFKDILSNSPGRLVVWCSPRVFYPPATAGADSWGGFSTERAELVSHIHSQCPGRVVVLSADMHALGIDDGSNHDFLPGGGEPLPTFQSSPLDIVAAAGTGTFSEGLFANNGQFGTMEVVDAGGTSIDVVWKGWDSSGALLSTHSFSVSL